jgi:hypothetical protein
VLAVRKPRTDLGIAKARTVSLRNRRLIKTENQPLKLLVLPQSKELASVALAQEHQGDCHKRGNEGSAS